MCTYASYWWKRNELIQTKISMYTAHMPSRYKDTFIDLYLLLYLWFFTGSEVVNSITRPSVVLFLFNLWIRFNSFTFEISPNYYQHLITLIIIAVTLIIGRNTLCLPLYTYRTYFFRSWTHYLFYIQCSVMQSNGNSFCGDVVLDSFNKASFKDNIFDKKQICSEFYYEDFKFSEHFTKM